MPNFNGTGPQGQGPTGRRLGNCNANAQPGNPEDNSSFTHAGRPMAGIFGRGQGRGRGLGNGFGQGGQRRNGRRYNYL